MFKKHWKLATLLALPLMLSGLAYAQVSDTTNAAQSSDGYVCPLTGEELPCPNCCPVNE